MDKKTIIIFLLIILGLFGLMVWGQSIQTSNSAQSESIIGEKSSLIAKEILYDFKTISMKDGLVSHAFSITNPTGVDIEIKTLTTSCMCTKAYIEDVKGEKGPFGMPAMGYVPDANLVIKAGQSQDIKVVYDPNAHGPAGVGKIDRFIYLKEADGKTVTLEIKAIVTP